MPSPSASSAGVDDGTTFTRSALQGGPIGNDDALDTLVVRRYCQDRPNISSPPAPVPLKECKPDRICQMGAAEVKLLIRYTMGLFEKAFPLQHDDLEDWCEYRDGIEGGDCFEDARAEFVRNTIQKRFSTHLRELGKHAIKFTGPGARPEDVVKLVRISWWLRTHDNRDAGLHGGADAAPQDSVLATAMTMTHFAGENVFSRGGQQGFPFGEARTCLQVHQAWLHRRANILMSCAEIATPVFPFSEDLDASRLDVSWAQAKKCLGLDPRLPLSADLPAGQLTLIPSLSECFVDADLQVDFLRHRAKVLAQHFPGRFLQPDSPQNQKLTCYICSASGWSCDKQKAKVSLHLVWPQLTVDPYMAASIRFETLKYFCSDREPCRRYSEQMKEWYGNGLIRVGMTPRIASQLLPFFGPPVARDDDGEKKERKARKSGKTKRSKDSNVAASRVAGEDFHQHIRDPDTVNRPVCVQRRNVPAAPAEVSEADSGTESEKVDPEALLETEGNEDLKWLAEQIAKRKAEEADQAQSRPSKGHGKAGGKKDGKKVGKGYGKKGRVHPTKTPEERAHARIWNFALALVDSGYELDKKTDLFMLKSNWRLSTKTRPLPGDDPRKHLENAEPGVITGDTPEARWKSFRRWIARGLKADAKLTKERAKTKTRNMKPSRTNPWRNSERRDSPADKFEDIWFECGEGELWNDIFDSVMDGEGKSLRGPFMDKVARRANQLPKPEGRPMLPHGVLEFDFSGCVGEDLPAVAWQEPPRPPRASEQEVCSKLLKNTPGAGTVDGEKAVEVERLNSGTAARREPLDWIKAMSTRLPFGVKVDADFRLPAARGFSGFPKAGECLQLLPATPVASPNPEDEDVGLRLYVGDEPSFRHRLRDAVEQWNHDAYSCPGVLLKLQGRFRDRDDKPAKTADQPDECDERKRYDRTPEEVVGLVCASLLRLLRPSQKQKLARFLRAEREKRELGLPEGRFARLRATFREVWVAGAAPDTGRSGDAAAKRKEAATWDTLLAMEWARFFTRPSVAQGSDTKTELAGGLLAWVGEVLVSSSSRESQELPVLADRNVFSAFYLTSLDLVVTLWESPPSELADRGVLVNPAAEILDGWSVPFPAWRVLGAQAYGGGSLVHRLAAGAAAEPVGDATSPPSSELSLAQTDEAKARSSTSDDVDPPAPKGPVQRFVDGILDVSRKPLHYFGSAEAQEVCQRTRGGLLEADRDQVTRLFCRPQMPALSELARAPARTQRKKPFGPAPRDSAKEPQDDAQNAFDKFARRLQSVGLEPTHSPCSRPTKAAMRTAAPPTITVSTTGADSAKGADAADHGSFSSRCMEAFFAAATSASEGAALPPTVPAGAMSNKPHRLQQDVDLVLSEDQRQCADVFATVCGASTLARSAAARSVLRAQVLSQVQLSAAQAAVDEATEDAKPAVQGERPRPWKSSWYYRCAEQAGLLNTEPGGHVDPQVREERRVAREKQREAAGWPPKEPTTYEPPPPMPDIRDFDWSNFPAESEIAPLANVVRVPQDKGPDQLCVSAHWRPAWPRDLPFRRSKKEREQLKRFAIRRAPGQRRTPEPSPVGQIDSVTAQEQTKDPGSGSNPCPGEDPG